ncbi:flavin reductase family protein [Candidatus Bathyarchaeota archaeon]|nr:MAG: flavin reductase family protein [Candidatus Bathyarchaeota archaeon]
MKKEEQIRAGLGKLPIRPVYLVSMEHDGRKNIITIGMFAFFSGNPTLVGIGVKTSRFSYELIKKSGEFVVNVVDEKLMDAVRICGESSGRDLDKFERANLTPVKGRGVDAPHIEESPLSIECKVVKELETGDHNWFIGEVQAVHARLGYEWKQGMLFKWIGKDGLFFEVGDKKGKY